MSEGRVITAYILFTVVTMIIPWLIVQSWISLVIGGGFAIAWWIVASIFGDGILLKTLRARPLNIAMYSEIAKIATARRITPKIGPPLLWMIDTQSPMLLSIGLKKASSSLVFTRGFLDGLEDKSQIGLLQRELESIRSGLTAANTALASLLWIILLPGRIGTLLLGKVPGEPNILASILNLVPVFILGYPSALVGFNRAKVHAVDSATLRNLENPDYLPYALMKLQELLLKVPYDCDLALGGCCTVSPNSHDAYQALFKLHPTTPKRVDRLRIQARSTRRKFNV